jgi:hypothetical protein
MRARLRISAKWACSAAALLWLAVLFATWWGSLTWKAEPAICALAVNRGVVVVAWTSDAEIERRVKRVLDLPSLPQGDTGSVIIERYRKDLRNAAAAEVEQYMHTLVAGSAPGSVPGWLWCTKVSGRSGSLGSLMFAAWIPLFVFGAPAAFWWGRDLRAWRRVRAGRCRGCGYDRRGLAEKAVCPECGAGS